MMMLMVSQLMLVTCQQRDELLSRRRLARLRQTRHQDTIDNDNDDDIRVSRVHQSRRGRGSTAAFDDTDADIDDARGHSRVHQDRRSRGRLLSRLRHQETRDDSKDNGDNDNTDKTRDAAAAATDKVNMNNILIFVHGMFRPYPDPPLPD